ncbi:hypothetical protein QUA42_22635 [Microcoleus sp. Pol11C2]|uniref:hypothetical protein n=1 Tax=Microcoleus sp. Pol11C2 TaxID=3055389 RepID=UPI002FD6F12B
MWTAQSKVKPTEGASAKLKAALAGERRRDVEVRRCLIAPDCLWEMPAILVWEFWRGRSHSCRNLLTARESPRSFSDIYEIK